MHLYFNRCFSHSSPPSPNDLPPFPRSGVWVTRPVVVRFCYIFLLLSLSTAFALPFAIGPICTLFATSFFAGEPFVPRQFFLCAKVCHPILLFLLWVAGFANLDPLCSFFLLIPPPSSVGARYFRMFFTGLVRNQSTNPQGLRALFPPAICRNAFFSICPGAISFPMQ